MSCPPRLYSDNLAPYVLASLNLCSAELAPGLTHVLDDLDDLANFSSSHELCHSIDLVTIHGPSKKGGHLT